MFTQFQGAVVKGYVADVEMVESVRLGIPDGVEFSISKLRLIIRDYHGIRPFDDSQVAESARASGIANHRAVGEMHLVSFAVKLALRFTPMSGSPDSTT
ncbi:MAG: hypothetical protein NTV34_21835 [Proteobacteria bacterium]|nr:hypothetical protein [Pseudomonadota bacterium]